MTACICCQKAMPNIMEGIGNQPNGGLEFTTHGHYGSSVFDPMDGTFIAINVCDGCLLAARERGHILIAPEPPSRPRPEYSTWTWPPKS